MIRKIIEINEERCNGCGLCIDACHENAIGMIDGKAKLLREDYCDGLGDCLPACPTGAISFTEKEVTAEKVPVSDNLTRLANFPIQIKLLPLQAPYLSDADLLIAADCTAYSCSNFHSLFMKDKVTMIGCPKLDAVDYSEKLTQIFRNNSIRSITVIRMTVPCCGGLTHAVNTALKNCEKTIPLQIITISPDGQISNE